MNSGRMKGGNIAETKQRDECERQPDLQTNELDPGRKPAVLATVTCRELAQSRQLLHRRALLIPSRCPMILRLSPGCRIVSCLGARCGNHKQRAERASGV